MTYAVIVPMYASISLLGYYVWGGGSGGANANINLNFPSNAANTLSIATQLIQCYYLVFLTSLCLTLNLELACGSDPQHCCTPAFPRGASDAIIATGGSTIISDAA
jgi:hypothetical protein